jgi:hypothetical protein
MSDPPEEVSVTFLYVRDENTFMDFDFYVNHHVPAMAKIYEKHGATSWFITEKAFDIPGIDSPYAVQGTVFFKAAGEDGLANVMAALQDPEAQRMAKEEESKYTNKTPAALIGLVKQKGTVPQNAT